MWTSTEYAAKFNGERAYTFRFFNDIKIEKTLTAKQKKEIEFQKSNAARFKVDLDTDLALAVLYLKGKTSLAREIEENEKRRTYPEYERTIEQQRKILEAMGDDSQERRDNEKKDKEKLDKLWLSTPVNLSFNNEHISDNKQKYMPKRFGLSILPVADKKWKGKL